MRISLQDIADRCACSKATVSMALRDHPRISAETRCRVQAAARDLGYAPDPGLSRIAQLRWRSRDLAQGLAVAYVTSDPFAGRSSASRMFTAADGRARELGYRLQAWSLREAGGAVALAEQLRLRGLRGLLLNQLTGVDVLADFPWGEFCAVACGLGHVLPQIHVVKADPFRAMDLAWSRALAAGHRRIGVAVTHHPLSWNEEHALGLVLVRQRSLPRGHARIPPLCSHGIEKERLQAWLEKHRPTVLISHESIAPALLAELGWSVPERLQLICSNKGTRSGSISGVQMQFRAIGIAAMDLLAQELAAHRYGLPDHQQIVHIAPRWVKGATLLAASA